MSVTANRRRAVPKVACIACGRVIARRLDGHPRKHSPSTDRLRGGYVAFTMAQARGQTCDGSNYPGDPP